MNNYTDTQLKQALVKMLPEDLKFIHGTGIYEFDLMWRKLYRGVINTELLHLFWLVEETLNRESARSYTLELHPKYINHLSADWCILHATWQQRTIALAKVKGVEIV